MTSGLPRFETIECSFNISEWSDIECGYLLVRENRDQSDSPIIRLRVAILGSSAESPEPDPLIYLSGGPGQSAVEWASAEAPLYQAILSERDVIFFDQRGTGYSEPFLDCPEVSENMADMLDQRLRSDDWLQDRAAAFLACRQRLVGEGIDLSVYNSAASAADVNDLRQVLGYEQVNLLGVSYGSRLALTVMRDFPEALRSVILDSPLPLQVDMIVDIGPNFQGSLDLLFERCATEEACAAAYPDLESTLDDLLTRLDQEPLVVQIRHPVTGSPTPVTIDGDVFMTSLLFSLYNSDLHYRLPKLIYDAYLGSPNYEDRLAGSLQLITTPGRNFSEGLQYSVLCREELPFITQEAALAQIADLKQWLRAYLEQDMEADTIICEAWDVGKAPATENEPVHSDIPTLVLSGELDYVTPAAYGDLVVETLPNASHVDFPYTTHGIFLNRRCGRQLAAAFLNDPAAPLDLSCLEALRRQPPAFEVN